MTKGGSIWHVSLGWGAMALFLLRMVWGVLGPVEARFSAFPPKPAAALAHLRQLAMGRVKTHPSHNPAGALLAYGFWIALSVVIWSGLVLTGGATPMHIANDKAAVASGDRSALILKDEAGENESPSRKTVEEVHEMAANLLLFLAALHVAGVLVESRVARRNFLAPMLLGKRRR